jgi:hypothetical protein
MAAPDTTVRAKITRLKAWNEGDTEAIPDGYGPDCLDWQMDLRAVLVECAALIESRQPKPEIGATVHAEYCAYTSRLVFNHPTPVQAAAHCEQLKAAVESGVFRLTVDPSAEHRERMVKMAECG